MNFKNHPLQFIRTLALLIILMPVLSVSGQEDPQRIHRLGLRGAYKSDNVDMWGVEASYQLSLKGIRRLEIDLGTMSSSAWDILQTTFIYQWRFVRVGGLSLYAGPGAGIGYASYGYGDDTFFGVVAADIGVDYTFRLPLQVAVDYRPEYSAWQKVGKEVTNQVAVAVRLAF